MHGSIGEFGHLPRMAQAAASEPMREPRRAPARGAPLVGIVRNPRSHRNKGHAPELADCANILVETPRSHAALRETLAGYAARGVDYIAVDGGDGTVRDVLTCGAGVFGDEWPTLVVLPKGKTNALAVDLGLPNVWSLREALEAIRGGKSIVRRPLEIALPGEDGAQVLGFILGAGVFTLATQAGQQAHRWGAFNSFAVGLTTLWGLLQTLFGGAGNLWRRGTKMRLVCDRSGREIAHSGYGSRDERFVVFASTLERFPLGMRPFGPPRPGLKLALIDAPLRRMLALIPLALTGFHRAFMDRHGFHRIDAEELELELGDRFILDGEYFPAGRYSLRQGPELRFVVP
jgi:diacylglycerol kinase (ATP)